MGCFDGSSVTGLTVYVSLPVMAVVGTAYTALGGMRAVIWTDVFQSIIMIAGLLAVLIKVNESFILPLKILIHCFLHYFITGNYPSRWNG